MAIVVVSFWSSVVLLIGDIGTFESVVSDDIVVGDTYISGQSEKQQGSHAEI